MKNLNKFDRYMRISMLLLGLLMLGCQPITQPDAGGLTSSPPASANPSVTVSPQLPKQQLPLTAQVAIKAQQIGLEVAKTQAEQNLGLMGRSELAADRGMLFPFDPAKPVSFWMKNVLIDLDMVFLRNQQVVYIQRKAPPCRTPLCPTYGPQGKLVDQVIELRGGRAQELGLQVGDRIPVTLIESALP